MRGVPIGLLQVEATRTRPAELDNLRRPGALAVAGCLVVAIALLWAVWEFTVDDAYITFRYSQSWANGNGPVWNPGEDPVEGFTNFLWMAVLTVPALLGLDLALVAKVLGVLAFVGVIVQLYVLAQRHTPWRWAGHVAVGCFVVFLPTYIHAVSGLETMLFALLLLRLAAVTLGYPGARRDRELPVLGLLAALTRPDGALVAGVCIAIALWSLPTRRDRSELLRWVALLLVLPGLAYFFLRATFYGELLPNTFYVKVGDVGGGLGWLRSTLPFAFPPALALLVVWAKGPRRVGVQLALIVTAAEIIYLVSTPIMDYAHRFAFHVFPLCCLLVAIAAGTLARARPTFGMAAAATAAAIFIAVGLAIPAQDLLYGRDLDQAHVALGKELAEVELPADLQFMAIGDAGAIPYFSGWRTLDFQGLNDEAIAHGVDPTTRVLKAQPPFLVAFSEDGQTPTQLFDTDRLNPSRIEESYERLGAVQFRDGYWLIVMANRALPQTFKTEVADAARRASSARVDVPESEVTLSTWLDRLRERVNLRVPY